MKKLYHKVKLLIWPWVTLDEGWTEKMSFDTRFSLAWRKAWMVGVKRLPCGCSKRFSRKFVLYAGGCPEDHAGFKLILRRTKKFEETRSTIFGDLNEVSALIAETRPTERVPKTLWDGNMEELKKIDVSSTGIPERVVLPAVSTYVMLKRLMEAEL